MQPELFGPTDRAVVFDLETQRSFQEVGGRSQMAELGVSIGVLYDCKKDMFTTFTHETVHALVNEILDSTQVIGYNIKGFDYHVLSGYRPEVNFRKVPTLDLMEGITKALGFRVSLENVASSTLGTGKSGSGLDALQWYRQGRLDLIEEYCRQDVDITRRLWEFGRDQGYVRFRDRTGKVGEIPVQWDLQ